MATTRKPRPGSLPLPKTDTSEPPNPSEQAFNPQTAYPDFFTEEDIKQYERKQAEQDRAFTALHKARAKAEELAGVVRHAAFDDWVRRCVVNIKEPSEWTQARTLYESYLTHAKTYGRTRTHRALSVQELATETQWGRMMATMFPKKRRSAGWYYPLRCKRGG